MENLFHIYVNVETNFSKNKAKFQFDENGTPTVCRSSQFKFVLGKLRVQNQQNIRVHGKITYIDNGAGSDQNY